MRRNRERGALLGIVMVMLMVLMAASIFAFFTLRSDSGAAAQDRLAHQLFDCAEQGLSIGKATFSTPSGQAQWPQYFQANAPGTTLASGITLPLAPPNGPLPTPTTITPMAGYPLQYYNGNPAGTTNQAVTITLGATGSNQQISLNRAIVLYNNPGDITGGANTDTDNQAIIWSSCMEPNSKQSKSVQTVVFVPPQKNGNYFGQAGFGYNNSGNTNNTK